MDVVILTGETRGCDPHVERLKSLFDEEPTIFPTSGSSDLQDMKDILASARGDRDLLVLRDSSLPFDPSKLMTGIAIAKEKNIGILYLTSWLDLCSRQNTIHVFADGQQIRSTIGNRSTQAIFYQSFVIEALKSYQGKSRKKYRGYGELLQDYIKTGVKAALYSPNLVNYDIDLAISVSNYPRTVFCQTESEEGTDSAVYVWLAILIILIILVGWSLIQINGRR